MLLGHVRFNCRVSVGVLPVVSRDSVQTNPDFHLLRIVYNLGFLAYMLIGYAVEVVLVDLEVVGGVDGDFLGILQEEWLWRQR